MTVAKVTVHESYNPRTSTHDLAILELSEPVQYSDTIKPVCLPTDSAEVLQAAPRTGCYISGEENFYSFNNNSNNNNNNNNNNNDNNNNNNNDNNNNNNNNNI